MIYVHLSQKDTKHGEMILGCTNNRVSSPVFHWMCVSTLTKGVTDVYTHEHFDTMIHAFMFVFSKFDSTPLIL